MPHPINVMLVVGSALAASALITVSFIGRPHQAEAAKPPIAAPATVRQIPLAKRTDRVEPTPRVEDGFAQIDDGKGARLMAKPIKTERVSAFIPDESPAPKPEPPKVMAAIAEHPEQDVVKLPEAEPEPPIRRHWHEQDFRRRHHRHVAEASGGDICTRHKLHRVESKNGKSWHCR